MKKKLFFLLTLLVCCIGQVWGASYDLVTDASSLRSGDVIVIGNAAKGKVATAMGSNNYLNAEDVTIENGVLTSDAAIEITLGGSAAGWTLTTTDGTIGATAVKKMAMNNGTTTWTIEIETDGNATIASTNSSYGRILYNVSTPRFVNYASATSSSMLLPQIYKKGSVTPPPTKELVSIAVTGTPTKTSYYVGDAFDTDGLVVTGTYSDASKNEITKDITWTVTPETLALGTTSVSVKAKVGGIESSAYTVNGLTVTEKGDPSEELTLTFNLSSNPGGWPTANSTTLTNYTYTLGDDTYTFALKNVKCNSGYLMLTQPAALGLPAIEGYKLTKVVAKNSGGCSTSVRVGVSSSATSADYISGGEAQTWTTAGSSYTYNLTATDANTVYYLYVTSKNGQIVSLDLTYEAAAPSTTPSISADNVNLAADATSGEIAYTINNAVMGKTLSATTEASWISNIKVAADKVTFTTTANTGTAERTADITLKYEGATDKVVTVTQAKPVPTYASLAELVAAGEPTTDGEPVNVTLTNEEITKFYVSGSYTNGVYLKVGTQEVEIYCKNVPATWEVGGTISGTLLNCTWQKYGTTWELCPENWDALTYTAPAPGVTYTITWSVNGTVTTEDVEEGDPINFKPATVPAGYTDYVFRGWTASETVSGSTEPTYVTTATATGNITYYAVFAKKTTTGGGSGDYELVAEDQSDWSGDYLIAYSNEVFADGRVGGTSGTGMGAQNVLVNPEDNLDGTTVSASWGDLYNITLEEVSKGSGTYLMLTKDGKYNYQSGNSNGLASTENRSTAASHPITINFVSSSDVQMIVHDACIFHYNASGYFRFYKDGGQSAVYLYKKQGGTVTYSDWTTTLVKTAYTLSVTEVGYSTLYLDKAVEIPEGVNVYYCTYKDSESLNAVKMATGYIPALTGVIIETADKKEGTYDFEYTDQQVEELEGNVLDGVLVATPVQEMSGDHNNAPVYVLSVQNDKLGFYKYADTATLKANRAFILGAEEQPSVNGFTLDFGGQTVGVGSVISATNLKAGYDIQGRRVNQMQKGINILDGKKIIK